MTVQRVFCCPGCRLLQPPTDECSDCGAPAFWIEAGDGLLKYRRADDVQRKKGGIAAAAAGVGVTGVGMAIGGLLFGGFVVLPFLPLIAYGSLLGTAGVVSLRDRRHGGTVPIEISPVITAEGAVVHAGTARVLTGPFTPRTNDAPALVEQIVIKRKRGVLFRAVRAVPFLVETPALPAPFAVTGQLRVDLPELAIVRSRRPASDPLFAELGIPAAMLPAKVDLEVQTVRPGAAVAVHAVLEDATLPELAFHREGGQLPIANGRRRAVVVIRAGS